MYHPLGKTYTSRRTPSPRSPPSISKSLQYPLDNSEADEPGKDPRSLTAEISSWLDMLLTE